MHRRASATGQAGRWSAWLPAVVVLPVLAGLVMLAGLVVEAEGEFRNLRTAGLDNTQWTASQVEVDLLRLANEISAARIDPGAERLTALRTRFDILYSRLRILERGTIAREVGGDAAVTGGVAAIGAFLDRFAPLIDGPDDTLIAGLPELDDAATSLHPAVRELVLRTLEVFNAQADAQRVGLASLLLRAAVVGGVMLGALFLLLTLLGLIYMRQQRAQAELRLARDAALAGERAKAGFVAVMSHEMRTPLNGLLASLELLGKDALDDRQARLHALALASATQLTHQVNDVLDIAKMDAGKIEIVPAAIDPVALVNDLADTLRPLAVDRGNRIVVKAEPGLPPAIMADGFCLRQILQNFLSNAIKFTDKGTITVHLSPTRDNGAAMLSISVIDSGIGISPENLARVFEDFVMIDPTYSREVGGSGLGLAICRRVASAMGARIEADSTLGKGSRFTLVMPSIPADMPDPSAMRGPTPRLPAAMRMAATAAQGGVTTAPTDDENAPEPAQTGTVPLALLAVDDNAVNRTVVAQMIAEEGHRADTAENGPKAVEMARCFAYDAVLMDISMPEMDGITAARLIREGGASAGAPIYALTAHAMPEELAHFAREGMRTCLLKPVRLDRLRAVLATLAAERDSAASAGAADRPGDAPAAAGRAQASALPRPLPVAGATAPPASPSGSDAPTPPEPDAQPPAPSGATASGSAPETAGPAARAPGRSGPLEPVRPDTAATAAAAAAAGKTGQLPGADTTAGATGPAAPSVDTPAQPPQPGINARATGGGPDHAPGKAPAPVLDPAVLDELSEIMGPEATAALLQQFSQDAEALLARLATAAPSSDWEALRSAAHELKGAAATIGAQPLSDSARALEMAAREADATQLPSLLALAQSRWLSCREGLELTLASQQLPGR